VCGGELSEPLPSGALANVNITIVNSTILLDDDLLDDRLESCFNNYDCETLSHCKLTNDVAQETGWFGVGWDYLGATGSADRGFMVSANYTPRVTRVSPEYGMPGQLVELSAQKNNHRFLSARE